jgi:hypothetical protein
VLSVVKELAQIGLTCLVAYPRPPGTFVRIRQTGTIVRIEVTEFRSRDPTRVDFVLHNVIWGSASRLSPGAQKIATMRRNHSGLSHHFHGFRMPRSGMTVL